MATERQVGLDALRGIAISLVLLFHFNQPVGVPVVDALLGPLRSVGWAGVELFFVLSGFLVGGIILREVDTPGGFDRRRFFVRRVFRLWPILYLYVVVMAVGGIGRDGIWPVLIHVQNYSMQAHNHLWSLAVEEHFYLLAAVTLPWLALNASPRRLVAILLSLIVGVMLLRLTALTHGVPLDDVQRQTPYRLDALAAGVLLAVVRHCRPELFAAVQQRRGLLILTALGGFALLSLGLPALHRTSGDITLAWLAAIPLVMAASDLRVAGLLVRPAHMFAALGLIAYPLYVWHIFAGNVAAQLVTAAGVKDPLVMEMTRLTSAIALAAILHRTVEMPFMALRDRLGARQPRAAAHIAMPAGQGTAN